MIFVDFDRTLASTKSGGSPLQGEVGMCMPMHAGLQSIGTCIHVHAYAYMQASSRSTLTSPPSRHGYTCACICIHAGIQSIDTDLAAISASYPTYVITRNRHVDEIAAFLAPRGVHVAGVCTCACACICIQVRLVAKGLWKADPDPNHHHSPTVTL